jgi:hypothetical protein
MVAAAAYRKIAFGASDEKLFPLVDGLAFYEPQIHGGLAVAEPAYRFDLLQAVRMKQQILRPFEELVPKVVFQAETDHGDTQTVRHGAELYHLGP